MMMQSLMENAVVQRLGWVLLHFLWEGAVVALLLSSALWALRRRRAQVRYVVSLAAMALLVIMPVGTFVVLSRGGLPTASMQAPAMPADGTAQNAGFANPIGSGGMAVAEVKESQAVRTAGKPAALGNRPEFPRIETRAAAPTSIVTPTWREQIVQAVTAAAPYLVPCWLLGVIGLSLWNVAAWGMLQRMKSRLTHAVTPALQTLASNVARRLSIRFPVRVLASVGIDSPMVVGFIKPVILLPAALATGLPTAQIEALLAHELAHIRRHDYLVNLLQTVIETLLFYHPAVWWISGRMRIEREHCCDDLAVEITHDRATDVRALAAIADVRPTTLAPAANTGGRGVLLPRLKRILGIPTRDGPSRWAAGVLAIALIAAAAITGAVNTATVARAAEDMPSKYPPIGRIAPSTTPYAVGERQQGNCELAGRVVDAEGKPVSGAKVYFCNDVLKPSIVQAKDVTWNRSSANIATVTADDQGKFKFNYMRGGRTDVWAETPTAAGIERNLDSDDKNISITLSPKKDVITISGHLFDIDGKTPLAGTPMTLFNGENDPKILAETITTDGGRYSFEIKPVYSYSPCLHVVAAPEDRAMAWATLPICSVDGFDLQLKPVSRLTGRVVTTAGQVLSGATVQVVRVTDAQFGSLAWYSDKKLNSPKAETDKDGWFTITALPQGTTASMMATHPDYQRLQVDVNAMRVEQEIPDIRLSEGAVIEGTIYLGSKDKPAGGAKVTLGYPMSPEKMVAADGNGHYRAGGIADMGGRPSQQSITATWGELPAQWSGITYHEQARHSGDHVTIDLVLEPSVAARQAEWIKTPGKPATSKYAAVILDDADPAYQNKPQYDDTLKVMGSDGRVLWQNLHVNAFGPIHAGAGTGHDEVWVGESGTGVAQAFGRDGGKLWEKTGVRIHAMAVDGKTGNAWALSNSGTIYGDKSLLISPAGEILKEFKVTGHSIAFSNHDDCFWIVSKNLQKVDREGNVAFTSPDHFPWVAQGVGINEKDGSVWVVEGRHPNVIDSRGRIWIFNADGSLRKSFSVDHDCRSLAVDSARGVAWVGGDRRLCKLDLEGNILAEAPIEYVSSIGLEPDTGYIWCASFRGGVWRLDSDAHPVWSDTSTKTQKWATVVAR